MLLILLVLLWPGEVTKLSLFLSRLYAIFTEIEAQNSIPKMQSIIKRLSYY